jgi:hypothetical protein
MVCVQEVMSEKRRGNIAILSIFFEKFSMDFFAWYFFINLSKSVARDLTNAI